MVRVDNAQFWNSVERIRYTAGLSHRELASRLALTSAEYWQMKGTDQTPNFQSTIEFLSEYQLSLESVFEDQIDFHALAQRVSGNKSHIPEQYLVGAKSRKRTAMNILNFIENHFGWQSAAAMLSRFQVDLAAFTNADERINIRFMRDFIKSLRARPEQLYLLGASSSSFPSNQSFSGLVRDCRSEREVFEKIFTGLVPYFEENYIYRLERITPDEAWVTASPSLEVQDALGGEPLGSALSCAYRNGVVSTFPRFNGFTPAKVTETKCIHRGDGVCELHIAFRRLYVRSIPGQA